MWSWQPAPLPLSQTTTTCTQFVPTADSPYTGGFAGSDYGIGRLSFAVKPTSDGIVPGSAWKFLRDGMHNTQSRVAKLLHTLTQRNAVACPQQASHQAT